MAAIWAPENRFRIWFEIEAHACDAMAELGIIPKDAARAIWEGGKKAMAALKAEPAASVEKIDAIERVTKHDVIAFTTWLGEFIGPQSRFVHQGLTSSDVLDTAFAVQLTQASDILIADVDRPEAGDVIAPAGRPAGHRHDAESRLFQRLHRLVGLGGEPAVGRNRLVDIGQHAFNGGQGVARAVGQR